MKTTLQDLIHAINIIGEDQDVYVDGQGSIAVCPPVKLTPTGRKHFEKALNATVVVSFEYNDHKQTYVSDDDESIDEMAFELLCSLAGYCNADSYDKWFEGKEAKMI